MAKAKKLVRVTRRNARERRKKHIDGTIAVVSPLRYVPPFAIKVLINLRADARSVALRELWEPGGDDPEDDEQRVETDRS
ncbi:MAG: hypothetical protein JRH20_29875 [Deltaproteobacteria bacterium]|nr:hypothetical protein [Deltaproteobacteria bacterium]